MKILYICETIDFGVGNNARDLINLALKDGHQVNLIWSPKRTGAAFAQWIKSLDGNNFSQFEMLMKRSPGIHDAGVLFKVISLVKKIGGVDIIHGLSSKGGAIARLVGRFLGVPAFYSPHAYIISDPTSPKIKRAFYKVIESILNREARVICTSAEELCITRQIGCKAYRFIPNGISMRSVRDSPIDPRLRPLRISFVGRFTSQKNPALFVEVADALSFLNVEFNMFGDGDLAGAVKKQAAERLGERIRFWGFTDSNTIWENTDILLCTSKYEGFPYTFIQALANGIPIISTPVGGTESVIVENSTGIVFEEDNFAQVVAFVRGFFQMPDHWNEIFRQCVLKSREFTVEAMYERTLAFYFSVK